MEFCYFMFASLCGCASLSPSLPSFPTALLNFCAVGTYQCARKMLWNEMTSTIAVESITKNLFTKECLEAINFVIITKTLCIQLKQTRGRPQKYYKNNESRDYSVIISARMVNMPFKIRAKWRFLGFFFCSVLRLF